MSEQIVRDNEGLDIDFVGQNAFVMCSPGLSGDVDEEAKAGFFQ
jgi:hypothetical protein